MDSLRVDDDVNSEVSSEKERQPSNTHLDQLGLESVHFFWAPTGPKCSAGLSLSLARSALGFFPCFCRIAIQRAEDHVVSRTVFVKEACLQKRDRQKDTKRQKSSSYLSPASPPPRQRGSVHSILDPKPRLRRLTARFMKEIQAFPASPSDGNPRVRFSFSFFHSHAVPPNRH